MATVRQYARRLKDGRPGRRFLDLYEFRTADPPTTAVRVTLWLAAIVLIGGGAAIGWLPGPGGFIAVFGLAIVAMEFRFMAVLLDGTERLGRNLWARLRGRSHRCRRRRALPTDTRQIARLGAGSSGRRYGCVCAANVSGYSGRRFSPSRRPLMSQPQVETGNAGDPSQPGMAAQGPAHVAPTREHRWLQKFVGDWTYEMDATMEPGQPPLKVTGSERIRALGDLWVHGEGTIPAPDGSAATTQITLGYDPVKKRFVGTWLGTMMTHLWVYDGELSADERTLTLNSEGPGMTDPATRANYRDVFEFKSDDLRTLTASVQGDDGQWTQFMTMDYHRKA